MNANQLFAELKRRKVYRVAVAYAVIAWLLIQIATQTFPFFDIPNWAVRLVVLLLALGFPVALVLAWAFELTPEGVRRTPDEETAAAPKRKRAPLFWSLLLMGVLAAGALTFRLYRSQGAAVSPTASANTVQARKSVAVLPFENLSEDKANTYFADGMQDEIITRLA
ncbi:MAG: hypothetical protein H0W04_06725, partial [Chthoniobacterales bacterium]|nr:hypothetical protein [Chthoniobacterales bacterium]